MEAAILEGVLHCVATRCVAVCCSVIEFCHGVEVAREAAIKKCAMQCVAVCYRAMLHGQSKKD